jgi:hypothetical protein
MSIDPQFVVSLKGRSYPLYAGVLDAATKAGLKSLTTTIVQIPSPENGNMAVVMARAEFEDGRVFEDVGDASPQNTSPQIATAALRMAATRAKGRVLRDAVNVGQTLLEELPDLDEEIERPETATARGAGNGRDHYGAEPGRPTGAGTRSVVAESAAPALKTRAAAPSAAPEAPEAMVCSTPSCGKALTKGQYEVSLRAYGQPLCPACQKAAAKT